MFFLFSEVLEFVYLLHKKCVFQKLLPLILAVTWAWIKAPVETTTSTGTMTSRPTPAHSFGTEAVEEMITVMKQKMNARRLV